MGAANAKDAEDSRVLRQALLDIEETRKLARLRGTELEWVDTAGDGWWAQHASLMHIQACVVPVEESVLVAKRFIDALERDPHQQFFTPQRQIELGLERARFEQGEAHPLSRHMERLPAAWRDDPRLRVLLLYYGYVAHAVCNAVVRLLACVRKGYSPMPTTTVLDQLRVIARDIPLPYPMGHRILTEALRLSRLARRVHGNPTEMVLVLSAWHWTALEAYAFGPAFAGASQGGDPMNAAFFPDEDATRPPENLDLVLVELARAARQRVPLPEERIEQPEDVMHMPAPPQPEQESMTMAQWATHWLKMAGDTLARVGKKVAMDILINDRMLVHLGLVFLAFHGFPRAGASFDTENWLGWTNRTDVELSDFFPNGPSPKQFLDWPGLREKLEDDLGYGPGGSRDLMYTGELNCVWSPEGLEKHAYDEVYVFCTHVARVTFLSMAGAMSPHFYTQNSRDIAIFVTSMLDEVKKQIPGAVLALRSKLISDSSYEGWRTHLRRKAASYTYESPFNNNPEDKPRKHENDVSFRDLHHFDEREQRMAYDGPKDARYRDYYETADPGMSRGTSSTVAPGFNHHGDFQRPYKWSDTAHQYVIPRRHDVAQIENEQRAVERIVEDRNRQRDEEVRRFSDRYEPIYESEKRLNELKQLRWNHAEGTPERAAIEREYNMVNEQLEGHRRTAEHMVRYRHRQQDKAAAGERPREWMDALQGHVRETEDQRQGRMRAVRARRPSPPRLPRDTPGAEAGAPPPAAAPPPDNTWFSWTFW